MPPVSARGWVISRRVPGPEPRLPPSLAYARKVAPGDRASDDKVGVAVGPKIFAGASIDDWPRARVTAPSVSVRVVNLMRPPFIMIGTASPTRSPAACASTQSVPPRFTVTPDDVSSLPLLLRRMLGLSLIRSTPSPLRPIVVAPLKE